jgi:hypothetical protein
MLHHLAALVEAEDVDARVVLASRPLLEAVEDDVVFLCDRA